MTKVQLIAVTGGPCAGKDTILPLVKQFLEDRGTLAITLQESATELMLSGFSPVEPWSDPIRFQDHLFAFQTAKEFRFRRMLEELETSRPKVLLCNRGVLDARAYADDGKFRSLVASYGEDFESLRSRYAGVVHMVTTADGKPEFYTKANNAARRETVEEAIDADRRTQAAWLGHPHFTMVDNRTDWPGKVRRVFAALSRFLALPTPREAEHKFLVRKLGAIPEPNVVVEIEQTYLSCKGDWDGNPLEERRIRKRTMEGVSSYYYTTKAKTDQPGVRIERERQITPSEYLDLLAQRHFAFETIRKRRTCFTFGGQHFELDTYLSPYPGLTILEAEVDDLAAPIALPPGWECDTVTGDDQWSNYNISRQGLKDDRI